METATTLKTAPLAHLEAGQYKNSSSFTGATNKKKSPEKKKVGTGNPLQDLNPAVDFSLTRATVLLFQFWIFLVLLRAAMSVPHRDAVDLTTPDENLSDTTPPAPPAERTTNHRPAANPAPSTPPHLRHASSQQPPATAHEIACPICLSAINHTERGPMSPFEWPHCGHALHTGCAAHLLVEKPGPPCPSCRQPWLSTSAELFHAQCQQRGVNLPEPLTSYDTRTNAPVPPPAPRHTVPLCCHRVILADPAHPERDEAWTELPDRHMQWAPNHHQPSNTWEAEWVCLRCNATVTSENPLLHNVPDRPVCHQHGPRCLVIDRTRNERGWICVRHPGDFHTCTPQQVPNTPQPAVLRDYAPEPSIPAPNNPQRPTNWHHQGPPHQLPGSTNSWLYVILLLAATGRLAPEAANQWANHESAAGRWAELVAALQAAGPIPWQQLHHLVHHPNTCGPPHTS